MKFFDFDDCYTWDSVTKDYSKIPMCRYLNVSMIETCTIVDDGDAVVFSMASGEIIKVPEPLEYIRDLFEEAGCDLVNQK